MSHEEVSTKHTQALLGFAEEIGKPVDEVTALDIIGSYSVDDLLPSRPISPELSTELGLEPEPHLHERPPSETRRLAAIGKEMVENPNKCLNVTDSRTQRFITVSRRVLGLD